MISQTLPFNKIALLTAKHFDGEISKRSNDFFVCGCTHARAKRQKAFYIKKSVCAQFYRNAYRDKLKILFKCLMGFMKVPMVATQLNIYLLL